MFESEGFHIAPILNGLKNRSISPVDIAKRCIERIEKFEPITQAWVCFDAESLLEQAKKAEARLMHGAPVRPLEGIPIGVKDIFNTADFPTQMGSPLWKDFTPGNDARVVFYLKQAGAILPGKTVTAEFAVHTLGKTINPHDPRRTPGTSSSGSAAAVAVGMVPAALGTQTAGSIVRPSSFCGVYGCKPSFGLIPRTGMLKTTDSLDSVGFFASHLDDLERIFQVIRVRGPNFPLSHAAMQDARRQTKPANRPWRVAVVRTHVWDEAPSHARDAFLRFVEQLAGQPDLLVEEAALPPGMEASHEIHETIYAKSLAYYFKEEFKRAELVSSIMNEQISRGNQIENARFFEALALQEELAFAMDRWFSQYDVLISLSTAGEAPLREERERPDPALMWTLTHLPVIQAPVFASPEGLPFGVQLVARRYNDLLLFRFAEFLRAGGLLPDGAYPSIRKVHAIA